MVAFLHVKKKRPWHSNKLKIEFEKWNLSPLLSVETFKIEKEESYKLKTCRSSSKIKCLDEEMLDVRMALMDSSVASKIGINKAEQVHDHDGNYKISIERLNCTVTNMNFFDPLVEKDIITETGYIRGCFEEDFHGILVQDKLREMLLNPHSENSQVFSDSLKDEFLFHLLKLVSVGGCMCQAEEYFTPIKNAIKLMYKDLVEVTKDERGIISITSSVYHVNPNGMSLLDVFPEKSLHNKLYAIVNDDSSCVTFVFHPYKPFW